MNNELSYFIVELEENVEPSGTGANLNNSNRLFPLFDFVEAEPATAAPLDAEPRPE